VLFTAALLLTLNYAPHDGLIMPQDTALRDMLTNQAMINTITVNCVIIFYAVAALRRAEVNLENEYARSEALVTTMMPTSIATRLKFMPDQRIGIVSNALAFCLLIWSVLPKLRTLSP
jgi:adenylate cyclase